MSYGTLAWPLEHAARVHAATPAVVDGAETWTYAQLAEEVARLGGALDALGAGPGERVAVLAGNTGEHLLFWLAVPAYGRVIVSLNHRLAAGELEFIVSDCGARVLVVDDERLSVGRSLGAETLVYAGRGDCPEDCVDLVELVAGTAGAAPPELAPDTLAAISYTGGTTGRPKGVMLSHGNLLANAQHFLYTDALGPSDVYVHAGPLFHVADSTMVHCVTWAGGTHVMLPRFSVPAFVEAVERHRATVIVLVPTMLQLLLDHLDEHPADLSSLRLLHYAAAPMPPKLLARAMRDLGCGFLHGYGMTEAAPGVTYLSPAEHAAGTHLDSVGHAIPGVQVRIDAIDGEVGEVCVRGPNVMLGYWHRPEATADAFTDDGWYRTGDAGSLRDGYLHLADRLKDMIISGGENVYSIEVEAAVASFPGVHEVAVVGRPDERWGERVHAIVVGEPGVELDPVEIVEHCRGRIAGFKLPRSFEFRIEPLPKSGAGKVLKASLRQVGSIS